MALLSVGLAVERSIRVAKGEAEWWQLLTSVVIVMVCGRFFLDSRRAHLANQTPVK